MAKKIEDYVCDIVDFPIPGIIFRDITTVLGDKDGFKLAIDTMIDMIGESDADVVTGTESRGFMFAAPIAYTLGKAFVPIRKKGKLPRETVSVEYALEYGTAAIEVHKDAIKPGDHVIIVDDLLATGGTLEASVKLVESVGGIVDKIVVLIELVDLKGRELLKDYEVCSAVVYEGE